MTPGQLSHFPRMTKVCSRHFERYAVIPLRGFAAGRRISEAITSACPQPVAQIKAPKLISAIEPGNGKNMTGRDRAGAAIQHPRASEYCNYPAK